MDLRAELINLYNAFDGYPMTIAMLLKHMIQNDSDSTRDNIDELYHQIKLNLGENREKRTNKIVQALKHIRILVLKDSHNKQFIEAQIDDLIRMQAVSDYIKNHEQKV